MELQFKRLPGGAIILGAKNPKQKIKTIEVKL